jgi:hypothetical protein
MNDCRFRKHTKWRKEEMAAAIKIKTIPGRPVRDVDRSQDLKD